MKKNIFQFTLVLKNVNENTPDLEDSLYEAGCDDALINFRNGAVYLEFDREAANLEDAVISAIKDVHSSSVDAMVVSVCPEDLVTEMEIANRTNINKQTISLWIKGKRRKDFPHPVLRLTDKSPLWRWHEVANWLYANEIIEDMGLVNNALFFANINAALEELDEKTRKMRHSLRKKIDHHEYT